MPIDLSHFTPNQRQAIEHEAGNLQLIACAGSGKTEVLACYVAMVLDRGKSSGLEPANVVAFTFQEKAAAELKQRVVQRVEEQLGTVHGLAEMYVGTIHGFCLELLKDEVPAYLKYDVLGEVQQHLLIDRNSRKSGLTTTTDLAGNKLRRFVETSRYVQALDMLRESEVEWSVLEGASIVDGLESYRSLLNEHAYLDYAAMMEEAVRLLETDTGVRKRIAARVKHVVVDEYQDVNPIQERLVRVLHELGATLCVIGDDDQTIHQWRGSDVQKILGFEDRYPSVTRVTLDDNFRSSEGIVETARPFIEQNADRLEKKMVAASNQSWEQGDICALKFTDPDEEAGWIVDTVRSLRGVAFDDGGSERGLTYSDMAILLRSVRRNAKPITDALHWAGIPFVVSGMNNLFDTAEAHAARQLFYYIAGPGNKRAEVLFDDVRTAWNDADLGIDPTDLDAALETVRSAKDGLSDSDEGRWGLYTIQRVYLTFIEDCRLREERVPGGRGEVVFYNLGKFSQLISDFEQIHFKSKPSDKYKSFGDFLQYQADDAYSEGWLEQQHATPDAVRVMTVHQAKGMQWPAVFVPALLRNRFPSPKSTGRSVWHTLPKDAIDRQERYETSTEDERRLFYVALTRSQKFLFMTWAPIEGYRNRYAKASDFWNNILASKYVKRRKPDFSEHATLEPKQRPGLADVLLSFSDLKYYFECPYQFKLRILYGFNRPIPEPLGYGKSLHDALAEIHFRAMDGNLPNEAEVPALVGRHLHTPFAYPALKEQLTQSAEGVVGSYLKDNAEVFPQIEYAEKKIELTLGDGINVVGRIDLVRRKDLDETSIVDFKTDERSQEEEVTELQLHIYVLGHEALTGSTADFVEIYELDEGKRLPRAVDEDFVEDVKIKIRDAATSLRTSELPPTPARSLCESCDYLKLCSAGEAVCST